MSNPSHRGALQVYVAGQSLLQVNLPRAAWGEEKKAELLPCNSCSVLGVLAVLCFMMWIWISKCWKERKKNRIHQTCKPDCLAIFPSQPCLIWSRWWADCASAAMCSHQTFAWFRLSSCADVTKLRPEALSELMWDCSQANPFTSQQLSSHIALKSGLLLPTWFKGVSVSVYSEESRHFLSANADTRPQTGSVKCTYPSFPQGCYNNQDCNSVL